MKNLLAFFCAVLLLLGCTSCSKSSSQDNPPNAAETVEVTETGEEASIDLSTLTTLENGLVMFDITVEQFISSYNNALFENLYTFDMTNMLQGNDIVDNVIIRSLKGLDLEQMNEVSADGMPALKRYVKTFQTGRPSCPCNLNIYVYRGDDPYVCGISFSYNDDLYQQLDDTEKNAVIFQLAYAIQVLEGIDFNEAGLKATQLIEDTDYKDIALINSRRKQDDGWVWIKLWADETKNYKSAEVPAPPSFISIWESSNYAKKTWPGRTLNMVTDDNNLKTQSVTEPYAYGALSHIPTDYVRFLRIEEGQYQLTLSYAPAAEWDESAVFKLFGELYSMIKESFTLSQGESDFQDDLYNMYAMAPKSDQFVVVITVKVQDDGTAVISSAYNAQTRITVSEAEKIETLDWMAGYGVDFTGAGSNQTSISYQEIINEMYLQPDYEVTEDESGYRYVIVSGAYRSSPSEADYDYQGTITMRLSSGGAKLSISQSDKALLDSYAEEMSEIYASAFTQDNTPEEPVPAPPSKKELPEGDDSFINLWESNAYAQDTWPERTIGMVSYDDNLGNVLLTQQYAYGQLSDAPTDYVRYLYLGNWKYELTLSYAPAAEWDEDSAWNLYGELLSMVKEMFTLAQDEESLLYDFLETYQEFPADGEFAIALTIESWADETASVYTTYNGHMTALSEQLLGL